MLRALYVILCSAGMIGFYFAVKALEWNLSRSEFIAFACGFGSAILLYWAADSIERREKAQRDRA